jgi:hypothetical protein
MGLPTLFPMDTYPYARNEDEAVYYQRVHYLASALLVFGAGDEALTALAEVWKRVMESQGNATLPYAASAKYLESR